MSPDWYVEYIQVIAKGQQFFFPCYEWVDDGFTTAEGKALIPSKTEHEGKFGILRINWNT